MTDAESELVMQAANVADREVLSRSMRKLAEGGDDFSVLMVDINKLQRLNDEAGRAAGDDVMRAVVDILADFAPEDMPLVHLGKDDFAVLLPNTNKLQAMIASTRIQGKAVISGLDTGDWKLAFNVGVATSEEGDPDALLVKAEERLLNEMARLNAEKAERVPLEADRKGEPGAHEEPQ